MLETLEAPDGTLCEPWIGACFDIGVPDEAKIRFLSNDDGIVHLGVTDDLTTDAQNALARLIHCYSCKPQTRAIVLNLCSFAGEVRGIYRLAASIEEAKRKTKVVAHLHCGCGVAYHAATFCDEIWSTPRHPVGYLGYGIVDSDLMGMVALTIGEANADVLHTLLDSRPQLDRDAAMKLFYSTENGEAAELHGLVDNLSASLLTAEDLGLGGFSG